MNITNWTPLLVCITVLVVYLKSQKRKRDETITYIKRRIQDFDGPYGVSDATKVLYKIMDLASKIYAGPDVFGFDSYLHIFYKAEQSLQRRLKKTKEDLTSTLKDLSRTSHFQDRIELHEIVRNLEQSIFNMNRELDQLKVLKMRLEQAGTIDWAHLSESC